MLAKKFSYSFVALIFLINLGISAEAIGWLEYKNQGVGALGRIVPCSRVIKVSQNAGPEGVKVAQLFSGSRPC